MAAKTSSNFSTYELTKLIDEACIRANDIATPNCDTVTSPTDPALNPFYKRNVEPRVLRSTTNPLKSVPRPNKLHLMFPNHPEATLPVPLPHPHPTIPSPHTRTLTASVPNLPPHLASAPSAIDTANTEALQAHYAAHGRAHIARALTDVSLLDRELPHARLTVAPNGELALKAISGGEVPGGVQSVLSQVADARRRERVGEPSWVHPPQDDMASAHANEDAIAAVNGGVVPCIQTAGEAVLRGPQPAAPPQPRAWRRVALSAVDTAALPARDAQQQKLRTLAQLLPEATAGTRGDGADAAPAAYPAVALHSTLATLERQLRVAEASGGASHTHARTAATQAQLSAQASARTAAKGDGGDLRAVALRERLRALEREPKCSKAKAKKATRAATAPRGQARSGKAEPRVPAVPVPKQQAARERVFRPSARDTRDHAHDLPAARHQAPNDAAARTTAHADMATNSDADADADAYASASSAVLRDRAALQMLTASPHDRVRARQHARMRGELGSESRLLDDGVQVHFRHGATDTDNATSAGAGAGAGAGMKLPNLANMGAYLDGVVLRSLGSDPALVNPNPLAAEQPREEEDGAETGPGIIAQALANPYRYDVARGIDAAPWVAQLRSEGAALPPGLLALADTPTAQLPGAGAAHGPVRVSSLASAAERRQVLQAHQQLRGNAPAPPPSQAKPPRAAVKSKYAAPTATDAAPTTAQARVAVVPQAGKGTRVPQRPVSRGPATAQVDFPRTAVLVPVSERESARIWSDPFAGPNPEDQLRRVLAQASASNTNAPCTATAADAASGGVTAKSTAASRARSRLPGSAAVLSRAEPRQTSKPARARARDAEAHTKAGVTPANESAAPTNAPFLSAINGFDYDRAQLRLRLLRRLRHELQEGEDASALRVRETFEDIDQLDAPADADAALLAPEAVLALAQQHGYARTLSAEDLAGVQGLYRRGEEDELLADLESLAEARAVQREWQEEDERRARARVRQERLAQAIANREVLPVEVVAMPRPLDAVTVHTPASARDPATNSATHAREHSGDAASTPATTPSAPTDEPTSTSAPTPTATASPQPSLRDSAPSACSCGCPSACVCEVADHAHALDDLREHVRLLAASGTRAARVAMAAQMQQQAEEAKAKAQGLTGASARAPVKASTATGTTAAARKPAVAAPQGKRPATDGLKRISAAFAGIGAVEPMYAMPEHPPVLPLAPSMHAAEAPARADVAPHHAPTAATASSAAKAKQAARGSSATHRGKRANSPAAPSAATAEAGVATAAASGAPTLVPTGKSVSSLARGRMPHQAAAWTTTAPTMLEQADAAAALLGRRLADGSAGGVAALGALTGLSPLQMASLLPLVESAQTGAMLAKQAASATPAGTSAADGSSGMSSQILGALLQVQSLLSTQQQQLTQLALDQRTPALNAPTPASAVTSGVAADTATTTTAAAALPSVVSLSPEAEAQLAALFRRPAAAAGVEDASTGSLDSAASARDMHSPAAVVSDADADTDADADMDGSVSSLVDSILRGLSDADARTHSPAASHSSSRAASARRAPLSPLFLTPPSARSRAHVPHSPGVLSPRGRQAFQQALRLARTMDLSAYVSPRSEPRFRCKLVSVLEDVLHDNGAHAGSPRTGRALDDSASEGDSDGDLTRILEGFLAQKGPHRLPPARATGAHSASAAAGYGEGMAGSVADAFRLHVPPLSPSRAGALTDGELVDYVMQHSLAQGHGAVEEEWRRVVAEAERMASERERAEAEAQQRLASEAAAAAQELAAAEQREREARDKEEAEQRREQERRAEAEATRVVSAAESAQVIKELLGEALGAHQAAVQEALATERVARGEVEQTMVGILGTIMQALAQVHQRAEAVERETQVARVTVADYRSAIAEAVRQEMVAAMAQTRFMSPILPARPPPGHSPTLASPVVSASFAQPRGEPYGTPSVAAREFEGLSTPSTGRSLAASDVASSVDSEQPGSPKFKHAYCKYLHQYLQSPAIKRKTRARPGMDLDFSEGEVYEDAQGRQRVFTKPVAPPAGVDLDLSDGEVFVGVDGGVRVFYEYDRADSKAGPSEGELARASGALSEGEWSASAAPSGAADEAQSLISTEDSREFDHLRGKYGFPIPARTSRPEKATRFSLLSPFSPASSSSSNSEHVHAAPKRASATAAGARNAQRVLSVSASSEEEDEAIKALLAQRVRGALSTSLPQALVSFVTNVSDVDSNSSSTEDLYKRLRPQMAGAGAKKGGKTGIASGLLSPDSSDAFSTASASSSAHSPSHTPQRHQLRSPASTRKHATRRQARVPVVDVDTSVSSRSEGEVSGRIHAFSPERGSTGTHSAAPSLRVEHVGRLRGLGLSGVDLSQSLSEGEVHEDLYVSAVDSLLSRHTNGDGNGRADEANSSVSSGDTQALLRQFGLR